MKLRCLALLAAWMFLVFYVPSMAEPEAEADPDTQVDIKIDPGNAKSDSNVAIDQDNSGVNVKVESRIHGQSDEDDICCYVDGMKKQNGTTWVVENKGECMCLEGDVLCEDDQL